MRIDVNMEMTSGPGIEGCKQVLVPPQGPPQVPEWAQGVEGVQGHHIVALIWAHDRLERPQSPATGRVKVGPDKSRAICV
jgi:hypothetical protein